MIAPSTTRISEEQRRGEPERLASLRPCSSSSVKTGTNAALSAASANRLRTRFGIWKAIVNAENAAARAEVARRDDLAHQPGDARQAGERSRRSRCCARRAAAPPGAVRGRGSVEVSLWAGRPSARRTRRPDATDRGGAARASIRSLHCSPPSWPTSTHRRSASSAPSASASRTAATRRRSRRTSAASRPPSARRRRRRRRRAPQRSCRRSTRPSSAARCTATPARARSPAPRALRRCRQRSARSAALRGCRRGLYAAIAPTARSAAGVVVQLAQAARGQLEVARAPPAPRAATPRVGPARLLDAPVGRPRAALHRGLDLRRRLARLEPRRDRQHLAHATRHQRNQARQRLALLAQLEDRRRRAGGGRARRARRRAPRPGARRSRRGRRVDLLDADRARPAPCSSASFSSSRSSRCWRSPTCATSACAAAASSVDAEPLALGRRPSAAAPGPSALLLRDVAARGFDRLGELRRRLRAAVLAGEEGDRRVGRDPASGGTTCASTSASFQRSTPSTITKRRPIANVIALQRAADGLRRRGVALEHLEPRWRRSRPRRRARSLARRSAMRPWSSPWMRYAGLKVATRRVYGAASVWPAPSPGSPRSRSTRITPSRRAGDGRHPQRAPAGSARCRRGRCAATRGRRRAAPRASTAPGGRRVAAPTSIRATPRPQRRSSAGSPGSALPWWATFSTSTGARASGASTSDSASAVSSTRSRRRRQPRRSRARWGLARRRRRAGSRRRPQHLAARRARAQPLARAPRRRRAAARAGRGPRSPAVAGSRTAAAPVEHQADRQRAEHRRRAAVVVGLRVGDDEHVEPPHARAARSRSTIRPSGGPVSTRTAWPPSCISVASP